MIRAVRLVAVTSVAALAVAALTACTPNVVNDAQSWLNGQDGVASASIVVDRTSLYGSSGVVRGELDAGLDGPRLDALVRRVGGYAGEHGGTQLRLGYGDVDFVVGGSSTDAARATWAEVRGLDGVVAALATGDGVRVHVLRPEFRHTLVALEELTVPFEVEGFRTADDEEADRRDDDYGPPQASLGSFQVTRGAGCDPSIEQWSLAVIAAGYDAIDAATVDVCGAFDLAYREQTDLTEVAAEWAESQTAAVDPAPAFTVSEDGAGHHEISVTPGDATLFPVVAAFEASGAPAVQYVLSGDTLELQAWEDPASEALGILSSSPLAERLTAISLEGDVEGPVGGESVTATGTLAELGTLVSEAEALFPLHEAVYQVSISGTGVTIDLYSPPGTDPDMASFAAALRTSPIWTTHATFVSYLNGYVLIDGGVATIGDDYTDRQPYDDFIAAWNAG
jgi:hypothetical protein